MNEPMITDRRSNPGKPSVLYEMKVWKPANSLVRFGSILLLSLNLLTAPAQAGNRAMLELLKVLRDGGAISQEAYEALYKTALEEDNEDLVEGETSRTTKSPKKPQAPPTTKDIALTDRSAESSVVRLGHKGLEVESADGDFRFKLGGRLLLDAAWYDQHHAKLDNDAEVRSSRLSWRAILWDDWQFKSEVEFARDGADLKSNFLRYRGFKPVLITAGNFKEPFGLERWTSISETTFMERAAVSGALAPARSLGLGVRTSERRWTLATGLFGNRDLGGSGGGNQSDEESWAFTGRVTYVPLLTPSSMLHTGIAASYRAFDDGQIRFKARPESHVTEVNFVDTGAITDLDDVTRYGLEAAAVFGPFSFQTEYISTKIHRSGASQNLDFDGWYAYASYFLTGETRPYRRQRGVFRGVTPKRPLRGGGPGAWEVALRYSHLDLSDEEITGGQQDLLTFGLNWYLNANVRFMTNYVKVLDVDRPGSAFDGDQTQLIQIRSQVDF
ncbi:MAG: porin [Pseudomonadota bacterium]